MTILLRSLNATQQRGLALTSHGDTNLGKNNFQRGPSLAETTMQRETEKLNHGGTSTYGGVSGSVNFSPYRSTHIPTWLYPSTGLQHSYDKDRNFLSQFPLGFEGCFNCGQTDHRNTRDCALAKRGSFNKKVFYGNMGT